jgi:hypothetical protein
MGRGVGLAIVLAVALPSAARAVPVGYTLQSGSVSLTVDEYSPSEGRLYRAADTVEVAIASLTLIIDAAANAITIDLVTRPSGSLGLDPGTPAYADVADLVIESFAVQASGVLLANDSGYRFDQYVIVDATFGGFPSSTPVMPGAIGQGPIFGLGGGGVVNLAGVAVGFFESPFNENRLVVTGSFAASVVAPIPEPDAMLLFPLGLLVAGMAVRRRRSPRRWESIRATS